MLWKLVLSGVGSSRHCGPTLSISTALKKGKHVAALLGRAAATGKQWLKGCGERWRNHCGGMTWWSTEDWSLTVVIASEDWGLCLWVNVTQALQGTKTCDRNLPGFEFTQFSSLTSVNGRRKEGSVHQCKQTEKKWLLDQMRDIKGVRPDRNISFLAVNWLSVYQYGFYTYIQNFQKTDTVESPAATWLVIYSRTDMDSWHASASVYTTLGVCRIWLHIIPYANRGEKNQKIIF